MVSPEMMPFVVEEREKGNIVPVRLLSVERLVCIYQHRLRDRERVYSLNTGCLAVILSMRNLASERMLVHSLPARFDT